jgi:hypothetical protein
VNIFHFDIFCNFGCFFRDNSPLVIFFVAALGGLCTRALNTKNEADVSVSFSTRVKKKGEAGGSDRSMRSPLGESHPIFFIIIPKSEGLVQQTYDTE